MINFILYTRANPAQPLRLVDIQTLAGYGTLFGVNLANPCPN